MVEIRSSLHGWTGFGTDLSDGESVDSSYKIYQSSGQRAML